MRLSRILEIRAALARLWLESRTANGSSTKWSSSRATLLRTGPRWFDSVEERRDAHCSTGITFGLFLSFFLSLQFSRGSRSLKSLCRLKNAHLLYSKTFSLFSTSHEYWSRIWWCRKPWQTIHSPILDARKLFAPPDALALADSMTWRWAIVLCISSWYFRWIYRA